MIMSINSDPKKQIKQLKRTTAQQRSVSSDGFVEKKNKPTN